MKLISKVGIEAAPPVPVDILPKPAADPAPGTSYQVAFVASKPEVAPVLWSIPLSWKLSGLQRPELSMAPGVRAWINYSTLFSNWLYTSLAAFLATGSAEVCIPIPDQFIDDIGVTVLTFAREAGVVKIYC